MHTSPYHMQIQALVKWGHKPLIAFAAVAQSRQWYTMSNVCLPANLLLSLGLPPRLQLQHVTPKVLSNASSTTPSFCPLFFGVYGINWLRYECYLFQRQMVLNRHSSWSSEFVDFMLFI